MAKRTKSKDDYYLASQWTLMARKLKKHKLAQVSFYFSNTLYCSSFC